MEIDVDVRFRTVSGENFDILFQCFVMYSIHKPTSARLRNLLAKQQAEVFLLGLSTQSVNAFFSSRASGNPEEHSTEYNAYQVGSIMRDPRTKKSNIE
jgi:hypothetical protein